MNIDESQISPDGNVTVEENDMLDPENFNYSQVSMEYIGSSLDDSEVLNSSENKLNLEEVATKPLKKRTVSKSTDKVSASEKKVILNRTNVALTDFNVKPVSDPKPMVINTDNKSETESKAVSSVKNMSSAEVIYFCIVCYFIYVCIIIRASSSELTYLN